MKAGDIEKYGPWALVTGASSGIGEQFARLLAEQGFHLILIARRAELLEDLRQSLQVSQGVEVDIVCADLSENNGVDSAIHAMKLRDVGLLICNAGYGLKGEFTSHDRGSIEKMVLLNSLAPLRLVYELLPRLQQRGRGGVIFTGSIEGETPFPYSAAYAASKAFIHSLANGLWHEYKAYGIDILVLSPGSTDTQAPILQGISREQLMGIMQPAAVADIALKALGRRAIVIPGWHNRAFICLLRFLPRSLSTRLAGMGMLQAITKSKTSAG